MIVLVVTNLYPPHHVGGYELGCLDVVQGLRARGHEVHVLTSDFRTHPDSQVEPGVERSLRFVSGAAAGRHGKFQECRVLMGALQRHRPSIVYFWNQAGLSHWLPPVARLLGFRVAFFLSDTNFASWRIGAFFARWTLASRRGFISRTILFLCGDTFLVRGWPVIANQVCHFASLFLHNYAERGGIRVAEDGSRVIHWGIDLVQFSKAHPSPWPLARLLYVGQLIPQKGVHTAVAAVALLVKDPQFHALTLDIAGGGQQPDYEIRLRDQAEQAGIADRVTFLGKIPRSELANIYAEHDVLIFPSEWEEPFAITPLEAMSAGLVVVGTTTGGSGELMVDRETAMTFAMGDPVACAGAVRQLSANPDLVDAIRSRAREQVRLHHSLDPMVDAIEDSLWSIVHPRN